MTSLLGVYWSVMHRRPQDYDYFKRLQPSVFKIMDGGPNDYAWANANLPGTVIVARDWALSEQHSDMLADPTGTGQRHAREWDGHANRLGFDRARTMILGINEPRVWEAGVPEALRLYTIALCDEAARLGLRVGAMQLSVGWPNNTGPDTPPDWSPWHGVEAAIRRGHHALVLHEYWADNGPGENWGWWAGRSLKCPWQVPLIIGECGIDMYVKDGSVAHNARGWQGRMHPTRYAKELADYAARMSADPRFQGCCVFASDFASHEWYSFDMEPAYQAILATPIPAPSKTHLPHIPNAKPSPTPEVEPPSQNAIIDPRVPALVHPVSDPRWRTVTQRFGERPDYYTRFAVDGVPLKGHNGIDFGTPEGTPIVVVHEGQVIETGDDAAGYGLYVKVQHAWGESLYAHLSSLALDVGLGSMIPRGYQVGLSGNTGNSTGPHLHFGLRVNPYNRQDGWGGYVDPAPYLLNVSVPEAPTTRHAIVKAICAAALEFGVDSDLLLSLAWAESSFLPRAESSQGAKGLFQIMPATWAEWGPKVGATDPLVAQDSARVGAAYFAWLLKTLNGDVYDAIVAYNAGIGNVLNNGAIGPETYQYADKVIHGRDLLKAVGQ